MDLYKLGLMTNLSGVCYPENMVNYMNAHIKLGYLYIYTHMRVSTHTCVYVYVYIRTHTQSIINICMCILESYKE